MNAAVWLGAALFLIFGVEPALRSSEVEGLLQKSFAYLSVLILHPVRARFVLLSFVCGAVAVLHLLAEWLYLGRPPRRFHAGLLAALLALSLFSGACLEPHLRQWHIASLVGAKPLERQSARRSFVLGHAVSRTADFVLLGGVAIYFWRASRPPESFRFVGAGKFRS